jgi:hypothetical protein
MALSAVKHAARIGLGPLLLLAVLVACSEAPYIVDEPKGRIVLAEFFTFARCAFCPGAEHALDSLSNEYGDSLAVIAYHRRTLGDTLSPEYVSVREALYGVTTSPATVFDGVSGIIQTQDPGQNYMAFKEWIIRRRSVAPNIEMELQTTILASSVHLMLYVTTIDSIEPGDHRLFIVLYEDSVSFAQVGAPDSIFQYVVRKMVPDETGMPIDIAYPDSLFREIDFDLSPTWNLEKLGIVAFIQDLETYNVLQAIVSKRISG